MPQYQLKRRVTERKSVLGYKDALILVASLKHIVGSTLQTGLANFVVAQTGSYPNVILMCQKFKRDI